MELGHRVGTLRAGQGALKQELIRLLRDKPPKRIMCASPVTVQRGEQRPTFGAVPMRIESDGHSQGNPRLYELVEHAPKTGKSPTVWAWPELMDYLKIAGQPVAGPWPPHQEPRPDPDYESLPVAVPDPEARPEFRPDSESAPPPAQS